MADTLGAIGIAGGILMLVVGLVIVFSFVAVKRGESAMHGHYDVKAWWNPGLATDQGPGGAIAAKPGAGSDISVMQILLAGTGMFVIAVLFLFGVSVLGHLMD